MPSGTFTLAWNGDLLASGSHDRLILEHDIRTQPFIAWFVIVLHVCYGFLTIKINIIANTYWYTFYEPKSMFIYANYKRYFAQISIISNKKSINKKTENDKAM